MQRFGKTVTSSTVDGTLATTENWLTNLSHPVIKVNQFWYVHDEYKSILKFCFHGDCHEKRFFIYM